MSDRLQEIKADPCAGVEPPSDELELVASKNMHWLIAEVKRLRSLAVTLEQEIARLGGPGSWRVNCLAAEQQIIALNRVLAKARADQADLRALLSESKAAPPPDRKAAMEDNASLCWEIDRLIAKNRQLEKELREYRGAFGALSSKCLALEHEMSEERDALKRQMGDLQASLGHVQALRDQAVEIRDEMAEERDRMAEERDALKARAEHAEMSRRARESREYRDKQAQELDRLRAELRQWRGCPSCMEDHPEGTICPPHEVQVTGQAWHKRQTRQMAARAQHAEMELQSNIAEMSQRAREFREYRDKMGEERDTLRARVSKMEREREPLRRLYRSAQADFEDAMRQRDRWREAAKRLRAACRGFVAELRRESSEQHG